MTSVFVKLKGIDSLFLKTLEDADKELGNKVDNLVIVDFKGYLDIQTDKFSQVTMGVRVFSTEDATNGVYLTTKNKVAKRAIV